MEEQWGGREGLPKRPPIMAAKRVLAAKKAGTAVLEAVDLLELCVQCPASVLRTLLDFMVTGASDASLAELGLRLQAAMDVDGAGERGVLLVYNELLESPGEISLCIRVDAMKTIGHGLHGILRARCMRCSPADAYAWVWSRCVALLLVLAPLLVCAS